jgi:hypothetical protein
MWWLRPTDQLMPTDRFCTFISRMRKTPRSRITVRLFTPASPDSERAGSACCFRFNACSPSPEMSELYPADDQPGQDRSGSHDLGNVGEMRNIHIQVFLIRTTNSIASTTHDITQMQWRHAAAAASRWQPASSQAPAGPKAEQYSSQGSEQ